MHHAEFPVRKERIDMTKLPFPTMLPSFGSMMGILTDSHEPWKIGIPNMATDIRKVKDGREYLIDLPGFLKENISVSISEGILTVNAKYEKKEDEPQEQENYLRRERNCCSCGRSYRVGSGINADGIKASFTGGVLTVFVPDAEKEYKSTKITVD